MVNSVSENTASPGPGAPERQKLGDQAQLREALHQISHQNAINSPLLRLPAEIRTMVFNHVFQGESYVIGPGSWMRKRPSLRRDLGLLLVSWQLYHETALLPYKLGLFQLAHYYHDPSEFSRVEELLRGRSKAQIEVMARVGYYDGRWMDMESDVVMGTGVYWAARLQLT
ncbi:unnamed protein product [Alternaria alternata]